MQNPKSIALQYIQSLNYLCSASFAFDLSFVADHIGSSANYAIDEITRLSSQSTNLIKSIFSMACDHCGQFTV